MKRRRTYQRKCNSDGGGDSNNNGNEVAHVVCRALSRKRQQREQQQEQHRRGLALAQRWGSKCVGLALVLLLLGRPPAAAAASAAVDAPREAGVGAGALGPRGPVGIAPDPVSWGAGILRRLLGHERGSMTWGRGSGAMGTGDHNDNVINKKAGRRLLAEDDPEADSGSAGSAQAEGGAGRSPPNVNLRGAVAPGGGQDDDHVLHAEQVAAVAAQAAGGFLAGKDAPGKGGEEKAAVADGGGGGGGGGGGRGIGIVSDDGSAAEAGEDHQAAAAAVAVEAAVPAAAGGGGGPEILGDAAQDPDPDHPHAHAHEAAQVAAQVAAAAASRLAEASDRIVVNGGTEGAAAEKLEQRASERVPLAENAPTADAAEGGKQAPESGLFRSRKWWSKRQPREDNGGGVGTAESGDDKGGTSDGLEQHQQAGSIAAAAADFGEGIGVYGARAGGGVEAEAPPGAAGNETQAKSLMDAKVGLDSLRMIETEVEKHVDELLGLFTAEDNGGTEYQAAALGVQQEVEDIRSELVKLLRTLNTANAGILGAEHELQEKELELVQLHAIEEVEGAKGKLTGGLVKVDYATGEIQWDGDDAKGDKAGAGAASVDRKGAGVGGVGVAQAIEAKLKSSEWRKEVNPEEWDPALLHLDSSLLLDFVVLCMSAALGGVLAAGVGLPETLGYMVGGMVVGPSGANVIFKVKEVETFAQFGSIFLLFGHGLRYSTFMNTGRQNSNVYAPQGRMGAFTVLFVVFSALLACAAVLGIHDGVESVFLSAAATLSSTAMVTEFMAHSRLGDTVFARMVVDLVAVQDLIMCPLLAIPTAIMYAMEESEGTGYFVPRILGCSVLLLGFVMASRRVLPVAMARLVLKDKEKEQSSGLFTLGVVSYCLGVALVCERLNLSHEAGALFAGLLMVDSPFAKKAHASMQPLTSLFGGMYLGSLGMIVNPAFMVWNFGDVFGCVVLLVLIKSLIVAMVMKSFGFSWEASTLAGACMAQVSEISLFFVARAQHLKLIRRHHYLMAVATTIILMVASPLVIKGLQAIHGGAAFGSGANGTTSPRPSSRVGPGGSSGGAGGGGGLPGVHLDESGLPSRAERGTGKVGGKDIGGKGRSRGGSVDKGSGDNTAGEAEGQRRLRFRRAVPE